MALTTESCTRCECLSVVVELAGPVESLRELPNTYNRHKSRYVWNGREFFAYAAIPRSAKGTVGLIDVYFCFDEDDLDDIESAEFTGRFVRERLCARWKNVKVVGISEPVMARPEGVVCRKLRHAVSEEEVLAPGNESE